MEPSLLLLIPAYNEEHRIEPVLREYGRYFQEHYRGKFQLVVLLNGCRENTRAIVEHVAIEYPAISVREYPDPIGKGGALIEGLKLAQLADFIGYVDADGATPPKAFHELVKHTGQADCVIGSRWLAGARLHVEQSGRRQFASRIFHLVVELCLRMHIRDTQCGAKVMRRQAIEKIHPALRIADMAFDINLLYSLKCAGYTILEVPTEWTDKIGSKVTLFRTSLVMLLSVIRIRLIYSPFYKWLHPLRPLEGWIYRKLSAPPPLPGPGRQSPESKVQSPKSGEGGPQSTVHGPPGAESAKPAIQGSKARETKPH
jgi:glycosyltransferase involved in cell wall biosynthesis